MKRIEPKAEAPAATREDSTLFYGLVVGGTAIISILLTLVPTFYSYDIITDLYFPLFLFSID